MNTLVLKSNLKEFFSFLAVIFFSIAGYTQCLNNPGTINKIINFTGQSSTHNLDDTVFLCWQDRFYLDHNNDFVLSSDPDTTTFPAIGYAWYIEPPVIAGNKPEDIKKDNVFLFPNDSNIMITVDQLNGDAMFENYYFKANIPFNKVLNPESIPSLIYYAPITVDKRIGNRGYFEDKNSCAKVNIDEAFPVVYLNPIKISQILYNKFDNPLIVCFVVQGGLPEFYKAHDNKKTYYENLIITNIKGEIVEYKLITKNFSHGDTVTLQLPQSDDYIIDISDGVSCSGTGNILTTHSPIPLIVFDSTTTAPNDTFCINVSFKNFNNIDYALGKIDFNRDILEYIDIKAVNPSTQYLVFEHNGTLGIELFSNKALEDIQFILCLKAIGQDGECTPITSYFEVASDFNDFNPEIRKGRVCIMKSNTLYVNADYCGAQKNTPEASLNFKIFNGKAPYNYIVKKDDTTEIISSSIQDNINEIHITDLYPGEYNIEVIDANLDTFVKKIFIDTIPPLQFDSFQITNPCFSDNNGIISFKLKNSGSLNYKIIWPNYSFNTDSVAHLKKGMYYITVKDTRTGCKTDTAIYLQSIKYDIQNVITTDATCYGKCNGAAKVIVSKNIDTPLEYYCPLKAYTGYSNQIDDLCAKEYSVYVYSVVCPSSKVHKSFKINQPEEKFITIDSIFDIDSIEGYGSIFISTEGDSYVFQWIGPNNFSSTNEDLDSLVFPGCYYLVAEDTLTGCTLNKTACISKTTNSFDVTDESNINIYPNPANEILVIELDKLNTKLTEISILEITGKVVKKINPNQMSNVLTVNTSGIDAGLYIIKIHTENYGNIYKKFIITR